MKENWKRKYGCLERQKTLLVVSVELCKILYRKR